MNFFQRQHDARRASRRLLILFVLAVIGIVVAVDVAVWLALGQPPLFGAIEADAERIVGTQRSLIVWTTLLMLAVIGCSSLFRIAQLRGGGAQVAQSMGASLVAEDTTDPSLRRLRNVVEEIAIASGVAVPQIYVMDEEPGINAFAAGYSANDAVISVTRGALDRLNRDELQAVIAHEFSHILNGDMRLNIHLMGVLFGILVLGIIGRKILVHARGGRGSRGVVAVLVAALVLTLVGYVGLFFGRLIKAGISRSRETLADASAVQFTRQTQGLAGALKKIAGLSDGSRLHGAATEEVSHMLFGDGLGFSSWFATHPPILDRIKAIEPGFDPGAFDAVKARWALQPPVALEEDLALGFAADGSRLGGTQVLRAAQEAVPVSASSVAAQVGSPADDDIVCAGSIGLVLSEDLRALARRQDCAIALVLALLLDREPGLRARQLQEIATSFGQTIVNQVAQIAQEIETLHPMLRLPLAALAFPVLRRRPRPELARFLQCCEKLIACDGRVSLFEYCLGRLLRRQTVEALDPSRFAPSGRRKLVSLREQAATVLAVLAQQGHADAEVARRAFNAGFTHLFPGEVTRYQPPADFVRALEQALPLLDELEPMGKAMLVEALVTAIEADGRISVAEAELLRTLCAVLHCPLPPMLEI